jgi:hypothetical protein
LTTLRKDKSPDYAVLDAPFIYLQGHVLVTYIENSTDVFGTIPHLEVLDSESESDEEGDDGDEGDAPAV